MDRRNARSEFAATIVFFALTLMLILGAAYQCVNDSLFRAMIALAQQSELLASRYFGEVAPDRIFADAWRGMQGAIPFRVELSEEPTDSDIRSQPRNWGLTLSLLDSTVTVVDVAEASPFFGFLLPLDKITGVDTLHEEVVIDLIDYLNSRSDGETRIIFERKGRTDSVTVQIAAMEPVNAPAFEIEDSVGYLALRLPSAMELDRALEQLSKSGAIGFIFDLRDSRGNDHEQAERLAEQIGRITSGKPTVVLIDETSKGSSEEIARRLSSISKAITIGEPSAGKSAVVDEIALRSGQRLYVSLNERYDREFSEFTNTVTDSSSTTKSSTAVVPKIRCQNNRMSPLLFELIHGGYLLDFVTATKFSGIPRVDEEESLFTQFEQYLQQRRFRHDPLGRVLSEMSLNEMNKEMSPIYEHMRQTHRDLENLDNDEYRGEILRSLLETIHRVKIGGEPSLTIRARTNDPCLAEALAHLKGRN